MANALSGSRSNKDYGKDVFYNLCLHRVFRRCAVRRLGAFDEDEGIMANLVSLEEDVVDGEVEPTKYVREAV